MKSDRGGRAIFGSPDLTTQARSPREVGSAFSVLEGKQTRLNRVLADLEERTSVRFELCVDALVRGDRGRAELYAREVASLKKLIGVVSYHERVLEQVILRLETVGEIGGVLSGLRSTREACGVWRDASRSCRELADENEVVCSGNPDMSIR